jgi:hypothetical protein
MPLPYSTYLVLFVGVTMYVSTRRSSFTADHPLYPTASLKILLWLVVSVARGLKRCFVLIFYIIIPRGRFRSFPLSIRKDLYVVVTKARLVWISFLNAII